MAVQRIEVNLFPWDPPDIDPSPATFSFFEMAAQILRQAPIPLAPLVAAGLVYDPFLVPETPRRLFTRSGNGLRYHGNWNWGDADRLFVLEHNTGVPGWTRVFIDGTLVDDYPLASTAPATYFGCLRWDDVDLHWFFNNFDRPGFDDFEHKEDGVSQFTDSMAGTTWASQWRGVGSGRVKGGWQRDTDKSGDKVAVVNGFRNFLGHKTVTWAHICYDGYIVGVQPPPVDEGPAEQVNMITMADGREVGGYREADALKCDVYSPSGILTTVTILASGAGSGAIFTALSSDGRVAVRTPGGSIKKISRNPDVAADWEDE